MAGVPLGDCLALVEGPPAARPGDLYLRPAVVEVQRQRHEGDAGLVLEVLMVANGAVVSAEQLLEQVWDEFADQFTNAVAVTMLRLRRKLGEPPLIETVIGTGYMMP